MNKIVALLIIILLGFCISFLFFKADEYIKEPPRVIPKKHNSSQKFIYVYDQKTGIRIGKWEEKND